MSFIIHVVCLLIADDIEDVVLDIQHQFPNCFELGLCLEEYLMWAIENPLPERFLRLIFQV
jgi:hypothetical protein